MNRRSFLGIIGVGLACPLSLLKAEPSMTDLMRNAMKNTKFVGTPPVWYIAIFDAKKGMVIKRFEGVYCDPN